MKVISVINQKGGVGKTTISVNLVAALAKAGRHVALIDLDVQALASNWLKPDATAQSHKLFDAKETPQLEHLDPAHLLSILASGQELYSYLHTDAIELYVSRVRKLAEHVLVFADHAADFGAISLAGLYAADVVLVPVALDVLSTQGTMKLLDTLERVAIQRGKAFEHILFIPNRLRDNARIPRRLLDALRDQYNGRVLTPIRENAALAEFPLKNETVATPGVNGKAQDDFHALAALLWEKIK